MIILEPRKLLSDGPLLRSWQETHHIVAARLLLTGGIFLRRVVGDGGNSAVRMLRRDT